MKLKTQTRITSERDCEKDTILRIIQSFIREEVLPYKTEDDKYTFYNNEKSLSFYVEDIRLTALRRCTNIGSIYFQNKLINNLQDFLIILQDFFKEASEKGIWKRFCSEIENHYFNLKNLSLAPPPKKTHSGSVYYEQIVKTGHPFHPCSKTKLGFSPADVTRYAPGYASEFNLPVLAVSKAITKIYMASLYCHDYTEWFRENFNDVYLSFRDALISKEILPDNYVPLPCHPWQWEHTVPQCFEKQIKDNQLIFLNNVHLLVTPTLSFRTVKPALDTNKPYIKLPVNVQATSVSRSLSPYFVQTAPAISDFLTTLFNKENNFENNLYILPAYCGLHISTDDDNEKQLAAIYRKSADNQLAKNEKGIVVAALCSIEPSAEYPLLIDLLKNHITTQDDLLAFFGNYAQTVITPLLKLFLHHGITLEPHQQNTIAVFEKNKLKHFLVRDFGGINIHKKETINFFKNKGITHLSHFTSEDIAVSRRILLHTAYQCHLGEIILLLVNYFDITEDKLWSIVAHITKNTFTKLKSCVENHIWQSQYKAILYDDWPCLSLLKMRLEVEYHRKGLITPLVNPLAKHLGSE